MPKRNIVITALAIAAALVVGGVAIGLLTGGDPSPAPGGYVTHEMKAGGHTVRFAYPGSWGDVTSSTEDRIRFATVRGPAGEGGLRPYIRVSAEPGATAPFDPHYAILVAQGNVSLSDVKEISRDDVEVPGAEQARRRVIEHSRRGEDGTSRRSRQSGIFAQSDDALFVTLFTEPAPGGSEPDAGAVLDSLRLDG